MLHFFERKCGLYSHAVTRQAEGDSILSLALKQHYDIIHLCLKSLKIYFGSKDQIPNMLRTHVTHMAWLISGTRSSLLSGESDTNHMQEITQQACHHHTHSLVSKPKSSSNSGNSNDLRKGVCYSWQQKGSCYKGASCDFAATHTSANKPGKNQSSSSTADNSESKTATTKSAKSLLVAKEKTIAYMKIWRGKQAARGDFCGLPSKPPAGSKTWAIYFCDYCSNNKFHTTLQCPNEFEFDTCTFRPALKYYKAQGLTRDRNVSAKDLYKGEAFDYEPFRKKWAKTQGTSASTDDESK
jgi:hypothetical protein